MVSRVDYSAGCRSSRHKRKLGWLEEVTAITLSCCLVSSEATEELLEVGQDWKVEKD